MESNRRFVQFHYENTPIQIYRQFHHKKLKKFQIKNSDIFHISAQNIDCGYLLEPPWRGAKKKKKKKKKKKTKKKKRRKPNRR